MKVEQGISRELVDLIDDDGHIVTYSIFQLPDLISKLAQFVNILYELKEA